MADDPNVQAPDNGVTPLEPGTLPYQMALGQQAAGPEGSEAAGPAVPPPQAPNTMEQAESQGSTQAPQMPARPPGTSSLGQYQGSKSQIFRSILGDFLYSAGKGLAASGHGPEANARGAGEAIGALPERDIMRQQLTNQAAQIQATAQLKQAQASQYEPTEVTVNGQKMMLPAVAAKQVLAAQARGESALDIQGEKGKTALQIAQEKNITELKKTAMIQGQQIPVDETVAQLAGIPELAGQPAGKGTWQNIKTALDAKGYKLTDLGQEGAWIIDRAGNRIKRVGDSPSLARGMGFALGRAMYTPFDTVIPGTNEPTVISNLKAIQTGAPHVSTAQAASLGGKYALFNDAYGILKNVADLVDPNAKGGQKVNLDDPGVSSRIAAGYTAIKDSASQGAAREVLSNILFHQPVNENLSKDERELVLTMAQGKAAGTGLRGLLGQAGANQFQQQLDSALMPGPQGAASTAALLQQVAAAKGLLDRVSIGQAQVGLNAPGAATALPGSPKPKKGGFKPF